MNRFPFFQLLNAMTKTCSSHLMHTEDISQEGRLTAKSAICLSCIDDD